MKQCIEAEDIDCVGGCEDVGYCKCFDARHSNPVIHPDAVQSSKLGGQRNIHSLVEAGINTAVGYSISVTANCIFLPMFGMHITMRDSLAIGIIFTIISVVRSYFLRRLFNLLHVKGILK